MVVQSTDHLSSDQPLGYVVLVTAPDLDTAKGLAKVLVETRVAGCVNVLPQVSSYYYWADEADQSPSLQCDSECLMVIKTTAEQWPTLSECVVQHHPYDVPECIAMPVERAHDPYWNWVVEQTRSVASHP